MRSVFGRITRITSRRKPHSSIQLRRVTGTVVALYETKVWVGAFKAQQVEMDSRAACLVPDLIVLSKTAEHDNYVSKVGE